jgi:hypothetical protein
MISFVLQGRPLYDNPSDARYFVAPREWKDLTRALKRDNNTLLYGARGMGKTTLLRQLQLALRDDGKRVAFVDAVAVTEPLELASRVHDVLDAHKGPSQDAAMLRAMIAAEGYASPPPGGVSRQLYDTLKSLGDDIEPTTVLLDASGSAQAVYGIFGRLRDTIWQLPHNWVVAVDETDRATVLKPPADAFFDLLVGLEGLEADQLLMVLQRRTDELAPSYASQIAADSEGNPREAIRSANATLVYGLNPAAELSARARLLDAAANLGRPHGMLMAELLDLGQASPSDRVLLDRLGLTRARVSTLMKQLLEADLVESTVAKSEGPGRPRTVYRPALGGRGT